MESAAPSPQPQSMMIRTAAVIVNRGAGGLSRAALDRRLAEVGQAFEAAGIRGAVHTATGSGLRQLARDARQSDVDCVVAAGGDGTVSGVASQLVGGAKPLGVLPIGTLNHFAKDLGLPLELNAAAAVIAAGHVRSIDVGEVNGHTFLNNSSIGAYPHVVARREQIRMRLGRGKWVAMIEASLAFLLRFPLIEVVVETEQATLRRTTPLVFIGVNKYRFSLLSIGKRERLDGGLLSLYLPTTSTRTAALRLALRALSGRLEQSQDFEAFDLAACRVDTRKRRLHVALDGETRTLRPPLEYRIRPQALRVLAPAAP